MVPVQWLFEADRETEIPFVTLADDLTLDRLRELLALISDTSLYQDSETPVWDEHSVSDVFSPAELQSLARFVERAAKVPQRIAIVV
jgi:hypothetical protein